MKVQGIELRKGERMHGFSVCVPGKWTIVSLRPFRVEAEQQGKRWEIDVSPREFVAAKKRGE